MPRLRVLVSLSGLLLALVAWGCSSAGDADKPAAAAVPVAAASLEVSSPVFSNTRPRKRIPKDSTCYGVNSSPPLDWSEVAAGAKSLALIVEEPEERISSANSNYSIISSVGLVHWVLFNIPPDVTMLPGAIPTATDVLPDGTVQGMNDFGGIGYSGPCPSPSTVVYKTGESQQNADLPREYYFRVYALDAILDLAPGATKADLVAAMEDHMLAYGETMGKYQGPRQQGWYVDASGTPVPNTPTPVP
jgi:Raf kinase inhibitor-like YbhB/YbcL family protein